MRSFPVPDGRLDEVLYSPEKSLFSVWAPSAEEVTLLIYPTGEGGVPDSQNDMVKTDSGRWQLILHGNLAGKFYTFKAKVDGRWREECPGIFCKATGVNGIRAAVVDMAKTNPEGWESDERPALNDFSDIIIYEMHHRDFSVDADSGISNKGKFLALTEEGTTDTFGSHTGIDHLAELGITHVHILPSFDFGSINEKHPESTYNWGYDPVNYNVPEGSFATDAYNPTTRIKEFKQMVMALHAKGLRVVLDVVYNHLFDAASSSFERLVPGYFFRHKSDGTYADGSGCGNETASDMPMMRKFMVESVCYWANEYHIDGFRFDLMGLHDIETMNAIRTSLDAIDPTIFLYGEGWSASTPSFPAYQLAVKGHISRMPRIAAFGDEMRDALRGVWYDDKQGAFLLGKAGYDESLKFGLVGAIYHPQINYGNVNYSDKAWANDPVQMISYVSCHDDMCLADRIKTSLAYRHSAKSKRKVSTEECVRLCKLAETAVLVSQGVPLIWCGDEIMRDRKGVRNSYNSPDSVNAIQWKKKAEHKDLFEYILHLINIRKSHKAFHLGSAELVRNNMHFLPSQPNVVAFLLNGEAVGDTWHTIIVALNGNNTRSTLLIPEGKYTIVCKDGRVNAEGIENINTNHIALPSQSAIIMYK